MNPKTAKTRLNLESLEQREVPAIILPIAQPSAGTLYVYTDDQPTTVTLVRVDKDRDSGLVFLDVYDKQERVGRFNLNSITKVQVRGGVGNDTFVSLAGDLPVAFFGGNGNDYLVGGNGNDRIHGGGGNNTILGGNGHDTLIGGNDRDVIKGMVGDDYILGGNGDDTLVGGDDNDFLSGGIGNDQIIGGQGKDRLYGDRGHDTLVTIDDGTPAEKTTDFADGGTYGSARDPEWDTLWTNFVPGLLPPMRQNDDYQNMEKVHYVEAFANEADGANLSLSADPTQNVDDIADPFGGHGPKEDFYRDPLPGSAVPGLVTFNPLFGSSGPVLDDVHQGTEEEDSWLLAPLGAIAKDDPRGIRQMVADFGDGTYGVLLGTSFYRMDADLYAIGGTNTPQNAGLGHDKSLWVAIIEEAYAYHRDQSSNQATSYYWLNGGNPDEAMQAYNATPPSPQQQTYSFPTDSTLDFADHADILVQYRQSCTLTALSIPPGSPSGLTQGHSYTVMSVFNSFGDTYIELRSPLSPTSIEVNLADLDGCQIQLTWGTF